MNNQLMNMMYENHKVEVIVLNNEPLFNANHVGEILEISKVRNTIEDYNEKQKVKLTNEMLAHTIGVRKIHHKGENFLTEAGVYKLVFKSRKKEAEKFTDWIAEEVLPSIRKTGGYSVQKTPQTYLEALKELVRVEEEKEKLLIENNHKQDVISAFSEDITLAEKRQRINQIVKFDIGKCPDRYTLLYSEFEKKYHISLSKRMQSQEVKDIKPKIRNKMDLIDRVLHMTNELFELAVTLFETDYKTILKKIEDTI